MTTQPPNPEAVEAARKYATLDGPFKDWLYEALRPHTNPRYPSPDWSGAAARILAAEVERLRGKADAVCEWRIIEGGE